MICSGRYSAGFASGSSSSLVSRVALRGGPPLGVGVVAGMFHVKHPGQSGKISSDRVRVLACFT